jgi:hypothetical protein
MTTEQKIIRAMLAVCGVGVRIIVMSGKEIRLRQTYAPLPMTTVCAVISGLRPCRKQERQSVQSRPKSPLQPEFLKSRSSPYF